MPLKADEAKKIAEDIVNLVLVAEDASAALKGSDPELALQLDQVTDTVRKDLAIA